MGLIDRAQVALTRTDASIPEKKKTGLLDRIAYASHYDGLIAAFREWLGQCLVDRGGFLCSLNGGDWHLLCPIGLDVTTANRFMVPFEHFSRFFNPTEWIRFTDTKLDTLRTCLSSRESEGVQAIHVKYLGKVKELRVCAVIIDSALSRYRLSERQRNGSYSDTAALWEAVLRSENVLQLLLPAGLNDQGSPALKAKTLLSSGMKAVLLSLSLESALGPRERMATDPRIAEIYRAIVMRIKKKAGASNIVQVCDDFSIRLVLFSSQSIDCDMYVHQLLSPLERAFGIPRINTIAVSCGGNAETVQDILKYLRGSD